MRSSAAARRVTTTASCAQAASRSRGVAVSASEINKFLSVVNVIKLFWRNSGKDRFSPKLKQQ